jgi:hypothetical protein
MSHHLLINPGVKPAISHAKISLFPKYFLMLRELIHKNRGNVENALTLCQPNRTFFDPKKLIF